MLGLDLETLRHKIESGSELKVGHIAAGNRVRMNRAVSLRHDEEWKVKLTRWEERLVWLLSGWLLKQYGYQRVADYSTDQPEKRAA